MANQTKATVDQIVEAFSNAGPDIDTSSHTFRNNVAVYLLDEPVLTVFVQGGRVSAQEIDTAKVEESGTQEFWSDPDLAYNDTNLPELVQLVQDWDKY